MKNSTFLNSAALFFSPLLIVLALICNTSAGAAGLSKDGGDLQVTSDKMVAEQGQSVVEFIGNVKAAQGDALLTAESLKVFFSHAGSADTRGQVDKIVAKGHVDYTSGNRRAIADQAVYTATDEKLILTGPSSKLLTGKSWVTGNKITLFRKDERVIVESQGNQRVQAFFDSEDSERKKNGAM